MVFPTTCIPFTIPDTHTYTHTHTAHCDTSQLFKASESARWDSTLSEGIQTNQDGLLSHIHIHIHRPEHKSRKLHCLRTSWLLHAQSATFHSLGYTNNRTTDTHAHTHTLWHIPGRSWQCFLLVSSVASSWGKPWVQSQPTLFLHPQHPHHLHLCPK